MKILIKDLNTNIELKNKDLQQVTGGWWYNPYYYAGYSGLGYGWGSSFGSSYGSMDSWLYNQGVNDRSHDNFISSIWA